MLVAAVRGRLRRGGSCITSRRCPLRVIERPRNYSCPIYSRSGQQLRFNSALVKDAGALGTVLRWSGLFEEAEVTALAKTLQQALVDTQLPNNTFAAVAGPRHTRIRAVLCAPERHKQFTNQSKFIHGREMFSYIARCLCLENPRLECSVQYDFTGGAVSSSRSCGSSRSTDRGRRTAIFQNSIALGVSATRGSS